VDALLTDASVREHFEGLRRLARTLVRPDLADDVVQETLIAGLRERSGAVRNVGGWLRGVLRRKASEARRAQRRRAAHEAAVKRGGALMDAVDVAAQMEVHERLLAAVRGLEAPYRAAVWIHYVEGRSDSDLARHLDVPVETIRTRVKRGVERLREELDRRSGGDRTHWMAALAPFAGVEPAAAAVTTAAVPAAAATVASTPAVASPALVAVGAVVVLGVGAGAFALLSAPREDGRSTDPVDHGPNAIAVSGLPPRTVAVEDGAASSPAESAPALERPDAGPRLAAASPRAAARATAHEGEFSFHYDQGWSFRTGSVVPAAEADVVFASSAGGTSSVALEAPGGGICSLESLRGRLPELRTSLGLWHGVLRAHPDRLRLTERARGDRRTPHSDVMVLRTRRGEWVLLAIVSRGEHPQWTKRPLTVRYALRPDEPEFASGKGDLAEGGVEIDTALVASADREAVTAAQAAAAAAEAERLERAAPFLERLDRLDRRAAALDLSARPEGGHPVRHAAVLSQRFAQPIGNPHAYVAATYSFEHETRDDVKRTHNDWDFVFAEWGGSQWIDVVTVTDDRSRVRDLGPVDFAAALRGDVHPGSADEKAAAVEGHTYLVHTLDSGTDRWTLFRVVELVPHESMLFAWVALPDPGDLRFLLQSPEREMTSPVARLQVRGGAGGGNPNRVFLDGTKNAYVRGMSAEPLDIEKPLSSAEDHRGYVEGGYVPRGKAFVVHTIEYEARVEGDSNGPGRAVVQVGPYRILHVDEDPGALPRLRSAFILRTIDGGRESLRPEEMPTRRRLAVEIPIRRDEEKDVFVEVANSSLVSVVLRGRFMDEALAPRAVAGRAAGLPWRLQRLADAPSDDAGVEAFGPVGPEERAWLEKMLSFGARGDWRRRIEAVLARPAGVAPPR
jgi:RNA polymerase sigma factor (sigma-70 family)